MKTLLILCSAQLLLACDLNTDLNDKTQSSSDTPWEMTQQTDKQQFSVKFSCQKKPFIGEFQTCNLFLKRGDETVSNAVVSIDGGMKAHGHGLPTSPTLNATSVKGQYEIEGLKFSMPGEWIVGFRVQSGEISDQTVFKLSI